MFDVQLGIKSHFVITNYLEGKKTFIIIIHFWFSFSPFFLFSLQQTGVLQTYHIIVRGYDANMNRSRILTNVTIDATAPTLLLANLTEGVTYTVSVAAANRAGFGPFSVPATLRLDPITKRLDQSTPSLRYLLQQNGISVSSKYFLLSFLSFAVDDEVMMVHVCLCVSISNYVTMLNAILRKIHFVHKRTFFTFSHLFTHNITHSVMCNSFLKLKMENYFVLRVFIFVTNLLYIFFSFAFSLVCVSVRFNCRTQYGFLTSHFIEMPHQLYA